MKKRIISLFLTLIMVVTSVASAPLSAHAGREDGQNCWACGHFHWDEYMCGMCGACSSSCTDDDCYIATHCNNCGECILGQSGYCDDCHWGACCVEEEGHCVECAECFVGDEDGNLCKSCRKCDSCSDGLCSSCGYCMECAEQRHMHCWYCSNCREDTEFCDFFTDVHCVECHEQCEECGECDISDGIELCEDCGLCLTCCREKAQEEGCDCGEYCIESSEYLDHICDDCGVCFDAVEQCEYCGFCMDCCQSNSECSDGMCVEDPDYDEHFCVDCGDCFHDVKQCESCEDSSEMRCEDCCAAAVVERGCDCHDGRCINDADFEQHMKTYHNAATASHTSAVPQERWSMNETKHWKECKYCEKTTHYTNIDDHNFNLLGICSRCGFEKGRPACILAQPKNVMCKTSDPAEDYQKTNQHTIGISARGIGNVSYQWYYHAAGSKTPVKAQNTAYCISGATSPLLTFFVPEDGCDNSMRWYCVIRDSKGNTKTSTMSTVYARHNWKWCNQPTKKPPAAYMHSITLKNGKTYKDYYSDGHMKECVGCGIMKNKGKVQPHRFGVSQYIGQDKNGKDWMKRACLDCGYTKYVQKHTHSYSDEAGSIIESQTTNAYHTLRCVKDDCDHTAREPHTWAAHIVRMPGNRSARKGGVAMDCFDCGYMLNQIDNDWTKDNYLVNACTGGTVNKFVINKSETLIIRPFFNNPLRKTRLAAVEGKKISGWSVTVRYATAFDDDGYACGEKTEDCTAKLSVKKNAAGNWEAKITGSVPAGSYLYFEPIYADCTHTGGTMLVDQKAPVCDQPGYTGDTVCKDCGKTVTTGVPINATGTEHTGTLTKIDGTEVTGSCTQSGFEGYFTCSACHQRVPGKNLGYKHPTLIRKYAQEPTCYSEGYSGDLYCTACGKLAQRGHDVKPQHDNSIENYKESTYTATGYSGDTVCQSCHYLSKQGHSTPVKESVKLTRLDITVPLPNKGDSASAKPPFAENTVVSGKAKVTRSIWATPSAPTTRFTGTFGSSSYIASLELSNMYGDYQVTKNTKVYVNGTQCELYTISSTRFAVRYTFTPKTKITTIDIDMTLPNEGDDGNEGVTADVTATVDVCDSYWTTKNFKKFESFVGGQDYYGWIVAEAKSGYALDANTFTTVNVNGTKAAALTIGEQTLIQIPVTATSIHDWDDGVVTKEATCIAGEKTFTCLKCGSTKTEKTPAAEEHNWLYQYSEGARVAYRCDVCGARKNEVCEANDFYYSADADGVKLESYYGNSKHVDTPLEIDGKPVTAIGDSCFLFAAQETEFEYISIPETVTHIGKAAFNGCAKVKYFYLPPKLVSIDRTAFYGCSSLQEIEFPSTLKSIGASAFQGCSSLKELNLPCCLESIGDSAFRSCNGITSVVIPDAVTNLEKSAFIGCENLKTAVVGSGITSLKLSTFGSCPKLESVVLPTSLTTLEYHAFNGNDALKTVYYRGTQEQWQKVTSNDNPVIDAAKKVYNFKTAYDVSHDYEEVKSVAATSTKLGYSVLKCTGCGKEKKDWFEPPTGKLTLKCTARTKQAQTVSYNEVKNATGYQVQCSDGGTQWAQTKTGPKTSVTFKGLKAGINYKFRVRFYIKGDDGVNYFSPWSKTLNSPTLPSGTSLTKLSGGSKSFTAQWKKASYTGYQVQYSTNAKFTGAKKVTIWGAVNLKTTVKKLSAKRVYYVRIRTFKTLSGTHYFSTWSKTYKVKTK
ncbi:MAG: leucine-rich repeat protein [Clostridia bacterium]|nr:leucine-rich repeat protein [Clostridia bacterium]